MAKGAKDPKPVKGNQQPLQPMIKNGKIMDDREEPCGDNQFTMGKY